MRLLADLSTCLRFFSRLPVPMWGHDPERSLAAAMPMVPVAGFIIGLGPALVLAIAMKIGLPPLLASTFAIAALIAVTGALHEDGLADCADGFGGGRTIERKLEIMRDSRIGTFGACAIGLSLVARVSAVASIAGHAAIGGAVAIVAASVLSRTACFLPCLMLPAARPDGLAVGAGRPETSAYVLASLIAATISFALLSISFTPTRSIAAFALTFLAAAIVSLVAETQIRGHTGDVAGAAQQAAEIAFLSALAAGTA